jgi:DNA-binding SARP family transcriptional activator/streptogramin lyase
MRRALRTHNAAIHGGNSAVIRDGASVNCGLVMEFRILGPLEVADDGRPVAIRRGKEQALLAYLLLHANEVVPSARLIDALWDERPPATASKVLHNAVSHLRRELGDGRLVTRDPGYLLRVEKGELDALEFERLVKEGRTAEALGLWRGPPLLELQNERFVDDARRHLEELRLGVLEDRIDEDLAAGRHAELIPELERLINEHPLRERPRGQLMRALYGAGRQADALEAYRQARRTLSEELGLEPGPELQELERKILNQELSVAQPRLPRIGAPPKRRRRWFVIAVVAALLVAGATAGVILATGEKSRPLVAAANSLAGVDPSSNQVVSVTPVGSAPRGVAVSTNRVWVANSADGTVSEYDANSLKLIQTIGIGAQATDLVEAGGSMWVATGIDNSLVKIDERTGGRLATIALPSADAATAEVAAGDGALWVISGGHGLKIDPVTDDVLVDRCCARDLTDVSFGAGAVWIAGPTAVARVSPLTARATAMLKTHWIPTALAAGYGSVWVGSSSSNNRLVVWQIDPATVQISRTVDIGSTDSFLGTVDVAVGAGSVWATNYNDETLVRIDPRNGSVLKTIDIGAHPRGIAVSKDRVWVTVS